MQNINQKTNTHTPQHNIAKQNKNKTKTKNK